MRRKPNTRPPLIKNHKLALKQNIPQDLNRLPLTTLQSTITHPAAQSLIINQLARDRGHVPFGTQLHLQVWELRVAGEDVAGVCVFRAGNFGVVRLE